MPPRWFPKVITSLQRAEVLLSTRLMTISPRKSAECVDMAALQRELQSYEVVDGVCREVAAILTKWLKTKFSPAPLIVPDKLCEPVLFRLRDATRLLMESGDVPPEFSKKEDFIFADLLVDRWHSYAERYWKQRWVKAKFGEGAGAVR
jgi:hypothetical protein